jgi:hypothetical protein
MSPLILTPSSPVGSRGAEEALEACTASAGTDSAPGEGEGSPAKEEDELAEVFWRFAMCEEACMEGTCTHITYTNHHNKNTLHTHTHPTHAILCQIDLV